jgi:cytochrome c553
MEMMCTSCHSKTGPAMDKVPLIASHPETALIVNVATHKQGRNKHLPLFDIITGEKLPAGNISCPSCHDVHQWNPGLNAKGDGIRLEGSALNSFLRASSLELMCSDCHGPDALFKYLYFHDPEKRTAK